MNWEKFKDKFHPSWHHKMKSFIESKECDEIFKFLKERAQQATIAPESVNTFRCFLETPYDKLNAVILGYCPYHSKIKGQIVADGLAMSCSLTKELQPSLEKFYDAVEKEVYGGLYLDGFREWDLDYLSKQGILLWNSSLTTEIGTAGAHQELWEPFTRHVIKEAIIDTNVPVIVLGKKAAEFMYLFPKGYPVFELTHPAYASYREEPCDTKGVFLKVKEIIKQNNGIDIDWINPLPF